MMCFLQAAHLANSSGSAIRDRLRTHTARHGESASWSGAGRDDDKGAQHLLSASTQHAMRKLSFMVSRLVI